MPPFELTALILTLTYFGFLAYYFYVKRGEITALEIISIDEALKELKSPYTYGEVEKMLGLPK